MKFIILYLVITIVFACLTGHVINKVPKKDWDNLDQAKKELGAALLKTSLGKGIIKILDKLETFLRRF